MKDFLVKNRAVTPTKCFILINLITVGVKFLLNISECPILIVEMKVRYRLSLTCSISVLVQPFTGTFFGSQRLKMGKEANFHEKKKTKSK